MDTSQGGEGIWSDFVADWRVLRDRIDGDGSSGLTQAGRLAHLNRLGLEALLGSLSEARRVGLMRIFPRHSFCSKIQTPCPQKQTPN